MFDHQKIDESTMFCSEAFFQCEEQGIKSLGTSPTVLVNGWLKIENKLQSILKLPTTFLVEQHLHVKEHKQHLQISYSSLKVIKTCFTLAQIFSLRIFLSSANKCLLKVAMYSAQMGEYAKALEIYEQVSKAI